MSPRTRDQIVPQLLEHARNESHWGMVMNGTLWAGELYKIPLEDVAWLGSFVQTYLSMAARSDYMREGGYRELRRLVEAGLLPLEEPLAWEVRELARDGELIIDDDTRVHILAILDWYEDQD